MKLVSAALVAACTLTLAGTASAHMLVSSLPVSKLPAKQQLAYANATISHSKATVAFTHARIRTDLKRIRTRPSYDGWVDFDLTVDQMIAVRDLRDARIVLRNHRWLLGYGQRLQALAEARLNPWAVPAYFTGQANCIFSHENGGYGWTADTGNGFGGGLQFMVSTWNTAASLSHGKLPYVSSTTQIAHMPPAAQIYAAYMIVLDDHGSWHEWPNTSRMCGYR